VCGDYADVNEQCVTDAGPMPDHRSKMTTFRGCRYFAVFDMENGYSQGETDEEGTSVFAITTEDGVFGPLRVPYGVKNAPRWFRNAVADIVRDLDGTESVFDDVAIGAPTFDLLVERVSAFLHRMIDYNIKLKAKKAVLGGDTLCWVGRIIDGDTIQIDRSRISGLLDAVAPYDHATLRSFIGSVNWLGAFIPCLASIIQPMTDLLKHRTFCWDQQCQSTFLAVKEAIRHAEWLEHPDPDAQLVLRTDASRRGIAGALLQVHMDGHVGPIAFFSRKLSLAETKYSTIEQEALAIVWSLNKCRPFIDYCIIVVTDHSNLQFMRVSQNSRVQRWSLVLNEFDAVIVHRPGHTNFLADYMSRAVQLGDQLAQETAAVEVNNSIAKFLSAERYEFSEEQSEMLRSFIDATPHDHVTYRALSTDSLM